MRAKKFDQTQYQIILLNIYNHLKSKRVTGLSIKKIKNTTKQFVSKLHFVEHPITADPTLITKPVDMAALLQVKETSTLSDEIEARVYGTPLKLTASKKRKHAINRKSKNQDPTIINQLDENITKDFIIAARAFAEMLKSLSYFIRLESRPIKLIHLKKIDRKTSRVLQKLANKNKNTSKNLLNISKKLGEIVIELHHVYKK